MTQPQFSIVTRDEGPWTVVVVTGEIDMATAPELETAISGAAGRTAVDLSAVEFMDSSGLRTLISANANPDGDDEPSRQMVLIAPSAAVVRLLEVAGLDAVFEIHDEIPPSNGVGADGS